jgi:hypothetical protein
MVVRVDDVLEQIAGLAPHSFSFFPASLPCEVVEIRRNAILKFDVVRLWAVLPRLVQMADLFDCGARFLDQQQLPTKTLWVIWGVDCRGFDYHL